MSWSASPGSQVPDQLFNPACQRGQRFFRRRAILVVNTPIMDTVGVTGEKGFQERSMFRLLESDHQVGRMQI